MASSLQYETHQYGNESNLQRLGVWKLDITQSDASKYWVIYVHGGGWRDPRITQESFAPTIDRILSSPDKSKASIAAFASIDYRLSPHPKFPQDPAGTPPEEFRGASHPDHIRDVWSALAYLQREYGFGSNYVLLGHSAGATLALQLLMGSAALKGAAIPSGVALPAAIIGLEGIYDLEGMAERLGPAYAELFLGAFGDPSTWAEASPMKFTKGFKANWKEGKVLVLTWSPDDELIDLPEVDGMARVLEQDGLKPLVFKDLEGTHDGMWNDGRPFARVILRTLEELLK